uniref:Uncharacterized protein n=1 Tax=Gossypium raimondii TaxID=29730 RepID=A0A0D2QWD4_GOSRA|nr:hypothetical protein B456_004G091100 [Gossypium raimondii]
MQLCQPSTPYNSPKRMSTEPTSIEGNVTPPTSIDSENLGVGASSQTKGTTWKRKVTPQRSEIWSHFTKIINSEDASLM